MVRHPEKILTEIVRKTAAAAFSLLIAFGGTPAWAEMKEAPRPASRNAAARIPSAPRATRFSGRQAAFSLPKARIPPPARAAQAPALHPVMAGIQALSRAIADQRSQGKAAPTAKISGTYENSLSGEGLPVDWVQKAITKAQDVPRDTRRLRKYLRRHGTRDATINEDLLKSHNTRYSKTVSQGKILNQHQAGICWGAAALGDLISKLRSLGKVDKNFALSKSHFYFYSMLEKSGRYLEHVIARTRRDAKIPLRQLGNDLRDQIEDGGWFQYFEFLASKYGLVPEYAMKDTASSKDTAELDKALKGALAPAAKQLRDSAQQARSKREFMRAAGEIKAKAVERVISILVSHLGAPVNRFIYRGKSYTPQKFAKNFLQFNPDDYVAVASYPGQKHGKYYRFKNSAIGASPQGQPQYDLNYLNVSPERLQELAAASIDGGEAVWFTADVENNFDQVTGIIHPKIFDAHPVYQFPREDEAKALSQKSAYDLGMTAPDHAMLLTGLDRPDPKGPVVKYRFENSWGKEFGTHGDGHLYAEGFATNVYTLMINKKFLDNAEKKVVSAEKK